MNIEKTKKIRGNNGLWITVSESDYEWLNQYSWSVSFGSARKDKWYATTKIDGETVRMHRLIVGLKKFDPRVADHLDADGLNNCRSNLEIVTQRENMLRVEKWRVNGKKYTKSSNTSAMLTSQEISALILLQGYGKLSGTELGQMIHGHKKSRKPQGYALVGGKIGTSLVRKKYVNKVLGESRNYYELKNEYMDVPTNYFESKLIRKEDSDVKNDRR